MDVSGWVILIGGVALVATLSECRNLDSRVKRTEANLKAAQDRVKQEHEWFENEKALSRSKHQDLLEARGQLELREQHLRNTARLLQEKSKAMPWLATMIADVYWLRDQADAAWLEK